MKTNRPIATGWRKRFLIREAWKRVGLFLLPALLILLGLQTLRMADEAAPPVNDVSVAIEPIRLPDDKSGGDSDDVAAAEMCTHGPGCTHGHDAAAEPVVELVRRDVPLAAWRQLAAGDALRIPVGDEAALDARVHRIWEEEGETCLTAQLVPPSAGRVALRWRDNRLAGMVQMPQVNLAYLLEEGDGGALVVRETLLSAVLCVMPVDGRRAERGQPVTYGLPRPTNEVVAARAAGVVRTTAVPALRSRPGSSRVVYLDFDGETVTDPYWNNGNTIVAPAARLNDSQINEVWRRVVADFDGFDVNVTTVLSDFQNAPFNRRTQVVVTDNDAAAPGAGGVAYLDSFTGWPSRYCWAFIDTNARNCAEVISHEVGHTLNLRHDGRSDPAEEYYQGHGSGATGWAPIMGVGYYRELVQWSKAEYPGANRTNEDDLQIIAGKLPYLADDYGDTIGAATVVIGSEISGRIGRNTDADVFQVELTDVFHQINLQPVEHSNLDAVLEVLAADASLIVRANPVNDISASAQFTLAEPQTVYLRVYGTGKPANGSDYGYTSYSSLGSYTLSGFGNQQQPPSTPVGLSLRAISGTQVELSWQNTLSASSYSVYREGVLLGTVSDNLYRDRNLTPGETYAYEVRAANSFGVSALSSESAITTPAADAFVMDGNADFSAYLLSNPGMVIHAALRGSRLYVSTWSPGDNGSGYGNDHHILISDVLLPSATTAMPWSKAGLMAIPGNKPFLAGESEGTYAGWFNVSGGTDLFKAPVNGLQLEGSIDLVAEFGGVPETVYLAAIAFGTGDGGGISAQAPAGNGNNDLEPDEFLAVPIASIRDTGLNGTFDVLSADHRFMLEPHAVSGGSNAGLRWYAVPGATYMLYRSDRLDLPMPLWEPIDSHTATAGQFMVEMMDPAPPPGPRYYRLRLMP
jgi:hypothetical protein